MTFGLKRRAGAARVVKFDPQTLAIPFCMPDGTQECMDMLADDITRGHDHTASTGEELTFISPTLQSADKGSVYSHRKEWENMLAAMKEGHYNHGIAWGKWVRKQLDGRKIVGGQMATALVSEQLSPGDGKHQLPQVAVSKAVFDRLIEYYPDWADTKTVWIHRYPVLSPHSVQECEFCVFLDGEPPRQEYSNRLTSKALAILEQLKTEEVKMEQVSRRHPLFMGIWLAEDTLLGAGGDCDGDLFFALRRKTGNPTFIQYNPLPAPDDGASSIGFLNGNRRLLYEAPADSTMTRREYISAQLAKKGRKKILSKPQLSQLYEDEAAAGMWLGLLTNSFDWNTYKKAKASNWRNAVRENCKEHFRMFEGVFDQRKGDGGRMEKTRQFINEMGREIRTARAEGDPFAILCCGRRLEGAADALKNYRTYGALLRSMFGRIREVHVEQDDLEIIPMTNPNEVD